MRRLFNLHRNCSRGPKQKTELRIEPMEDRLVMTATDITSLPWDSVLSPPVSEAIINLETSTGVLSITGFDLYNDDVKVSLNNYSTIDTLDDLVTVTIVNVGDPLVREFTYSSVTSILFQGLGGNDRFENLTALSSAAYGDAGNDILLGGSGIDRFFGGDGDDYLDGREGNDLLNGDGGSDRIFGDAGDDMLHGGTGLDMLFGGVGNDTLYGDEDNDQLDGGAGTNLLFGGAGADQFYSFKIPKKPAKDSPLTNDFTSAEFDTAESSYEPSFGWLDAKLTDAALRSLARFDDRDSFIQRADMLNLYDQVKQDGIVNSKELADLRSLCAAKNGLAMTEDVRVLSNKVVNTNQANAHYQGQKLGDLKSGDTSAKLNKLISKWFEGTDLPSVIAGTNYVWASGSLFQNGPAYSDVDQGALGDCYFVGALATIADKSPSTIESMFIDNGDGTFAVRFFNNRKADYVTVDRKLPVYINPDFALLYRTPYYAGIGGTFENSGNELWVALAEKAYVQLNESGWIGQNGKNSYDGIAFGYSQTVMRQVTGNSASNFSLKTTKENTIINEFDAGKAITFATKNSGVASNIVPNHIYAMLGYDSATQTFRLYNPWGPDNQPQYSTYLSFTWTELVASFSSMQTAIV